MGRSDDLKVTVVQGGDGRQAQTFSDGDKRRVDQIELEVGVPIDQLGDASPVNGNEVDRFELAGGDRRDKPALGGRSASVQEEPGGLGDDRNRRGELASVMRKHGGALSM